MFNIKIAKLEDFILINNILINFIFLILFLLYTIINIKELKKSYNLCLNIVLGYIIIVFVPIFIYFYIYFNLSVTYFILFLNLIILFLILKIIYKNLKIRLKFYNYHFSLYIVFLIFIYFFFMLVFFQNIVFKYNFFNIYSIFYLFFMTLGLIGHNFYEFYKIFKNKKFLFTGILFLFYSIIIFIVFYFNYDFILQKFLKNSFFSYLFLFIFNILINITYIFLLIDFTKRVFFEKNKIYKNFYSIENLGFFIFNFGDFLILNKFTVYLINIDLKILEEYEDNLYRIKIEEFIKYIELKDREIFYKFIEYSNKLKDNFEFDLKFIVGGEIKNILIKGNKVEDDNYIFATLRDITSIKKLKSKLYDDESILMGIFENVDLLGVILNKNGKIINVNNYFLEISGYERIDLINQDFFDIFLTYEEKYFLYNKFIKDFNPKRFFNKFTNEIIIKNGKKLNVNWFNHFKIDENGNLKEIISLGKIIEKDKLNFLYEEKFEKLLLLSHFINNFSYFVYNINDIIKKSLDEIVILWNKYYEKIKITNEDFNKDILLNEINSINSNLNEILRIVSILNYFNENFVLEKKIINLQEELDNIIKLLKLIVEKSIKIYSNINIIFDNIYESIETIYLIFFIVFNICIQNLKKKEIKDNEEKFIEIIATDLKVSEKIKAIFGDILPSDYILVSISDNGMSIKLEDLFDFEYDKKFAEREIYSLNFKLLKNILKNNNIFFDLKTNLKKGNQFLLFFLKYENQNNINNLNIENLNNENLKNINFEKESIDKKNNIINNKKILLIEDDKIISDVLINLLKRNFEEVKIATKLDEVFELIKIKDFDIYVIDLILPHIDGWNVYQKIKEMKGDVKVLFTTGYINTKLAKEIKEQKYPIIFKPFSLREFLEEINKLI